MPEEQGVSIIGLLPATASDPQAPWPLVRVQSNVLTSTIDGRLTGLGCSTCCPNAAAAINRSAFRSVRVPSLSGYRTQELEMNCAVTLTETLGDSDLTAA